MDEIVLNKPIFRWTEEIPVVEDLINLKETFWINPGLLPMVEARKGCPLKMRDIEDASARLDRFAPFLVRAFPETSKAQGRIESPLAEIPVMKRHLELEGGHSIPGRLFLKCDSHLPIAGSIKARGGIYEVLVFAEKVAIENNVLTYEDDYSVLMSDKARDIFSQYSIAVGSTGNLGLSIGIMGAALGFHVTVHMSADARTWKKELLKNKGVEVVEYEADYSRAVQEGRKQAQSDPRCHFIDDENSTDLFLGYAVAALRLKKQLLEKNIVVDAQHPLFVYLPCGVGGGPGGVSFGLKQLYGDAVHCFFAEPTHSPCMLLGMATGCHDRVCVQDFGIDNVTAADGLAVGRASRFVGKLMQPFVSGLYTIGDERMYRLLEKLYITERIALEPSALAGMAGPENLLYTPQGILYIHSHGLNTRNASHIVWATGGSMVPDDVMEEYIRMGEKG